MFFSNKSKIKRLTRRRDRLVEEVNTWPMRYSEYQRRIIRVKIHKLSEKIEELELRTN